MSIWRRALCSVTRRKSQTAAMILLLMLIVSAISGVMSVQRVMKAMQEQMERQEQPDFVLTPMDKRGGRYLQEDGEQAAAAEGVAKSFFRLNTLAVVPECETVAAQAGVTLSPELEKMYRNTVTVTGVTDFELAPEVVQGNISLREGHSISSQHPFGVVVHEAFAEKNDLNVGDILSLQTSEQQDEKRTESIEGDVSKVPSMEISEPMDEVKNSGIAELEIIGIYQGSKEEMGIFPQDRVENTMYTDLGTAQKLESGAGGEKLLSLAAFYIEENAQCEEVMEAVEKLPLDWKRCVLEESSAVYENVQQITGKMSRLISILVYGIMAVSLFVLSMVMIFRIRGKMYETGILLAVGISKGRIISQYLLEMLLIAVVSFVLAFYPAAVVSEKLGDTAAERNEMNYSVDLGMYDVDTDEGSGQHFGRAEQTLEAALEIMPVYGVCTVLILLSVGLSSIAVMRLKPREILSNMS